MKLGFHYHVPADHRGGTIAMPGYLGRFVDGLAAHCERVVCFLHSPRPSQQAELDYHIQRTNVELVSLGQHCSVPTRVLRRREFVSPVERRAGSLDAMLVRGPSPLLPAVVRAVGTVPAALLLVGSYVDGIDDLPQPLWRKELIRLWARVNQLQQDRVARQSLTFVNNRHLFDRYRDLLPHLLETRTTTLSEQDFHVREDTCTGHTVRLLYAGRYDRGKGLTDIVQAAAILVGSGLDVRLDLVGWDDGNTGVMPELLRLADSMGIRHRVTDHGRKPVGPELFAHYRAADVYVIASKTHEGFPRTIWEALAHSLPVVATRVGSIPHIVGDVVELAEPNSPGSVARAIGRVASDGQMRRGRIRRGLELARQNTLELRCLELVQGLTKWIESR